MSNVPGRHDGSLSTMHMHEIVTPQREELPSSPRTHTTDIAVAAMLHMRAKNSKMRAFGLLSKSAFKWVIDRNIVRIIPCCFRRVSSWQLSQFCRVYAVPDTSDHKRTCMQCTRHCPTRQSTRQPSQLIPAPIFVAHLLQQLTSRVQRPAA